MDDSLTFEQSLCVFLGQVIASLLLTFKPVKSGHVFRGLVVMLWDWSRPADDASGMQDRAKAIILGIKP